MLAAADAVPAVNLVFPDGIFIFYEGEQDGVKLGDKYEILRDNLIIAEAEVIEVKPHLSYGKILSFTSPPTEGDALRKIAETPEKDEITQEPENIEMQAEQEEVEETELGTAEIPPEGEEVKKTETDEPKTETGVIQKPEEQAPPIVPEREKTEGQGEIEKEVVLNLDGYHYLKFRNYGSSGNERRFLSENALLTYGATFEQGTDIELDSEFKGKFEIEGRFFQLPLQERELIFTLKTGLAKATMGDFPSEFRTGTLSPFNKKVSGGEVLYSTKRLDLSWLFSQSKSNTKTETFTGNGSYGPYKLNAIQILPGSVSVQINGQDITKDNYKVDYFVGKITFCSEGSPPVCKPITESDRVQVTYEQKLLLALKGGGIYGIGAAFRPGGSLKEVGFAHFTQQALRSEQQIKIPATYTISGDQLLAQTDPQYIFLPKPEDGVDPYVLLDPGFETITKNGVALVPETDYTITTDGYAQGIIGLVNMPQAGDIYYISYVYYSPDLITTKTDEHTQLNDPIFYLSQYTIYPGTETVKSCRIDPEAPCDVYNTTLCDQVLNSGNDYTINTNSNYIKIENPSYYPSETRRTCALYLAVPSAPPGASEYDHTVLDIFSSFKLSDFLEIDFERATSNADISTTPIQIIKEKITTFTKQTLCPSSEIPDPCKYTLMNTNIVEESLRLYLSTSDVILTPGKDYYVSIDTGIITFASGSSFATGTVAYVDYQYNPPFTLGVTSGNSSSLKGNTRFKIVSLSFLRQQTDTTYAPLGGNTTLETDRSETQLSLTLAQSLNFNITRGNYTRAQDIFQTFSTETDTDSYSLAYTNKGWLKSAKYTAAKEDALDNRSPNITNFTRDTKTYSLEVDVPSVKELSLSYTNNSIDYTDLTTEANSSNSKTSEYGLDYAPSKRLSVALKTADNTVSYAGATPYSTTNRTTGLVLLYSPIKLINITANINSQRRSDSRPKAIPTGLDSTTLGIMFQPFWKF
ncbi:MAG: hypothetical protein AB1546_06330, partial [bacterium]